MAWRAVPERRTLHKSAVELREAASIGRAGHVGVSVGTRTAL